MEIINIFSEVNELFGHKLRWGLVQQTYHNAQYANKWYVMSSFPQNVSAMYLKHISPLNVLS